MKTRTSNQEMAVSPVVGVMLMLVVTIIIAAVVSAYAGGMNSDKGKTPVATIVATEFNVIGARDTDTTACPGGCYGQGLPLPNNDGTASDIYVVFEHKGGDSLNLANIEMQLSSLQKPNEKSKISTSLTNLTTAPGTGSIGSKATISGFSQNWNKYLERWPDHGTIIKPGDKFILHADYATQNSAGVRTVNWLYEGGKYPFWIQQGDVLTYDLMDKTTGKPITSGQIAVPEFNIALV